MKRYLKSQAYLEACRQAAAFGHEKPKQDHTRRNFILAVAGMVTAGVASRIPSCISDTSAHGNPEVYPTEQYDRMQIINLYLVERGDLWNNLALGEERMTKKDQKILAQDYRSNTGEFEPIKEIDTDKRPVFNDRTKMYELLLPDRRVLSTSISEKNMTFEQFYEYMMKYNQYYCPEYD